MSSDDEETPDARDPVDPPSGGRRDPGARGVGVGTGARSYGLDDEDLVELRRGAPPARRHVGGRRALARLLAVVLVLVVIVVAGVGYVRLSTTDHRHSLDDAPAAQTAIVFGAGLQPDGRPSPMLADRIALAADLYEDKLVSKLLLTGGRATRDHDEVQVMHDRAVALGVPSEAIMLDRAGEDTYDSCYRAEQLFGIEQALIVTQKYHLARAVYTCRQLGIDADGVGAKDWGRYDSVMPRHEAREVLSTMKALVELHVSRPRPSVSPSPVTESGPPAPPG